MSHFQISQYTINDYDVFVGIHPERKPFVLQADVRCAISGTSAWRSGFILGVTAVWSAPTYSSRKDERPAVSGNILVEDGHISCLLSQNTFLCLFPRVTLVSIIHTAVLRRWLIICVTLVSIDFDGAHCLHGFSRLIVDEEGRHLHPGAKNLAGVLCQPQVNFVWNDDEIMLPVKLTHIFQNLHDFQFLHFLGDSEKTVYRI